VGKDEKQPPSLSITEGLKGRERERKGVKEKRWKG